MEPSRSELNRGWELAESAPGEQPSRWSVIGGCSTVAAALRALEQWSLSQSPRDFDASDWWYRCRFTAPATSDNERVFLTLGGLASVVDVSLNGRALVHSENMFIAHELDVSDHLRADNELVVHCHALGPLLRQKRARPRWRTRLVEQQNLRWFRTTLLGRMPGWSPPVAPVGPWRSIGLEARSHFSVTRKQVRTDVAARTVEVRLDLLVHGSLPSDGWLMVDGMRAPLEISQTGERVSVRSQVRVPHAELWWPHTHGAQPRYDAAVHLRIAGCEQVVGLDRVAFRTITADTSDDGFTLVVNDTRIFARGACWTPLDVVTLQGSDAQYDDALRLAREAGMNLLRLSGTLAYESDAFYERCDALGILVWQDFMFANMDYPNDDGLIASVRSEAAQLLQRLHARPCLAVLCGNSEAEQQAAMLGLERHTWSSAIFTEVLPNEVARQCPEVPYLTSTPSGGVMPFRVDVGVGHYYGVGAYRRPFDDARRARVRFASECLAFANLGEDSSATDRAPRDHGSSWDFADVRDHYLQLLFGVNPGLLRATDSDRYVALSKVVSAEVMSQVLAEWRTVGSTCHGALVWFYRDLWPGAGWGVLDTAGLPKAAYYGVKRALQPMALLLCDEGVNGLTLHALNETTVERQVIVEVKLYRAQGVKVGEGSTEVRLAARGALRVEVQSLFPYFVDASYAYRFGPPGHDVLVATMRDKSDGALLGEAFHFPQGLSEHRQGDIGLTASAAPHRDGGYELAVTSENLAQFVAVEAPGFVADDNHFHLAPGGCKRVLVRGKGPLRGRVVALNAHASAPINVVLP